MDRFLRASKTLANVAFMGNTARDLVGAVGRPLHQEQVNLGR